MLVIISYDIVDDKRRTILAKKLLDYAKRVQYSVFEGDLTNEQIKIMTKKILPYINKKEDSLRIYKICQTCVENIKSYGVKKGWVEEDVIVV